MKIFIKVKPHSKKEEVKKVDETHYVVSVKEPPVEGRANEAVIRVLSDYFRITKSQIRILKGGQSRNKVAEITSSRFSGIVG